MDLIIPGEQYFYLKARSVAERQRWLVALGSAKACLTDSRTQKEKGKYWLCSGLGTLRITLSHLWIPLFVIVLVNAWRALCIITMVSIIEEFKPRSVSN